MTDRTQQPYMAEPWFRLLEQAVTDHPRGIAGVADDLVASRAALSLILNGKYPAKTDRFARRVEDAYDRQDCPHLGEPVTRPACRAHALRQAPTSSPREMRHWRACQQCPHKPKET